MERAKLEKLAELEMLAENYKAAFIMFKALGDKENMQEVVIRLLERIKTASLSNEIQCHDNTRIVDILWELLQNDVVWKTCIEHLLRYDDLPLLRYLNEISPNKEAKKTIQLAIADILLDSFSENSQYCSSFSLKVSVHYDGIYLDKIKTTQLREVFDILERHRASQIGALWEYRHSKAYKKDMKLRFDYAVALGATKEAIKLARKMYWRLFKKDPTEYCRLLIRMDNKKLLSELKRWLEKRKKRLASKMHLYFKLCDFLGKKISDRELDELVDIYLRPRYKYIDYEMFSSRGLTAKNKKKFAEKYMSYRNFSFAWKIYSELRDASGLNRILKEAKNDASFRAMLIRDATEKDYIFEALDKKMLMRLVQIAISDNESCGWDCLKYRELPFKEIDYKKMAENVLETTGYVREGLFKRAGTPITVEVYRTALASLRCDRDTAEEYKRKIIEMM